MSSAMIIAAEMTLVLGVVLGLAVWELWRLKRDRAARKPPPPEPPAPDR
ncbi:hypothetical protein [Rhizobacter fulvus]|jgi:hypothetical protein